MAEVVNIREPEEPRKLADEARAILDFLNRKTGKNFRPVVANIEFIVARLREGYSADDLRGIIAMKCRVWLHDEKMREYLRPATLFNRTNCAQYSGELGPEDAA